MNKLYNGWLYSSFLLTILCSCGSNKSNSASSNNTMYEENNQTDTILTLYTYGLSNFEKGKSTSIIAKKWGINFQQIAGCVVTKELVDSAKHNNDSINILIERKYGTNWEDKFYQEVVEEFEREKMVFKILDNVDFIKEKDIEMSINGNKLRYNITPIENTTGYHASIEGWNKTSSTWVSFYRMEVNYKTGTFKLLADTVEEIR